MHEMAHLLLVTKLLYTYVSESGLVCTMGEQTESKGIVHELLTSIAMYGCNSGLNTNMKNHLCI